MKINVSRANFYLVDDVDIVVAVSEKQAHECVEKEYGYGQGEEIILINGNDFYITDTEKEVTDSQKLAYINRSERQRKRPLKVGTEEIVADSNLNFKIRRTARQELINQTEGKILFDVPFILASTEI